MDTTSSRPGLPVVVLTACGLAVLAAFLPWTTIRTSIPPSALDPLAAIGHTTGAEFARITGLKLGPITLSYTGWSFTTTLLGFTIPAWLVPAAALFVAGLMLLRLAPNTRVPRWLPLAFCGSGLLLLGLLAVQILLPDPNARGWPELGWYLALFAYLVMLLGLVRGDPDGMPTPSGSTLQRAVK